jgi:hypothetical protein
MQSGSTQQERLCRVQTDKECTPFMFTQMIFCLKELVQMLRFTRTTKGTGKTGTSNRFNRAPNRAVRLLAYTSAVALVAAATCVGMQAQSDAAPAPQPTLDLRASLSAPLDLSADSTSSSSAPDAAAAEDATTERLTHLSLSSDATQPPPRRSYGKPHYSDSMHNADGSNKYTFLVGGGFTLPLGGTHAYLTTSYDFQAGVGRNFSNKFAVLAEFNWDNFGFQTKTLNNLLVIYNTTCGLVSCGLTQLGGTSHVWSFTVDPTYNFIQSEKAGAYVVGGVGFYHKTANFTIPSIGTYCDFYGCFQYAANQTIDKYTSNAFGFNGGVGFTYRPSRFAGERFYAEARYVFVNNQARPYSLGLTSNYFNVFPQNSAKTTYIPITFGLRF